MDPGLIAILAGRLRWFGGWLTGLFAGQAVDAPLWWAVLASTAIAASTAALLWLGWGVARALLIHRGTATPLGAALVPRVRRLVNILALLLAIALAGAPLVSAAGPAAVPLSTLLAWLLVAVVLLLLTRIALHLVPPALQPLREKARHTASVWDDLLLDLAERVLRSVVVFIAIYAGATTLLVPAEGADTAHTLLTLSVIGLLGWCCAALVGIGDRYLQQRYRLDVPDNLAARRVYTQLMVLRRMAYLLIGILVLSLVLMQFEGIRRVGTSILASAGLAGVIIGFAAQRTLANLLAGIQIALTQPIRIDDAVIMEGEFGRIEEITLTYVVVALWDQRRLIVPLSRIIETPFQNWTRTGSNLLGTVTTRCDFSVPLDAMNAEARRLAETDQRWDRRVFAFQITEWGERTVEVRVLLSAFDAGKLFDLRCTVREGLLRWLAARHPEGLPRVRLEPRAPEPPAVGAPAALPA